MTVDQIYQETVKSLSLHERLAFAARILSDLSGAAVPVDESAEWTDEDMKDFTNAGSRLIERRLGNYDDA